uniref:Uncharacterized protein n=1 Tax=Cacopsylla melanoneura TaxID=428564 RepID=A0A8D9E866_9HEMI
MFVLVCNIPTYIHCLFLFLHLFPILFWVGITSFNFASPQKALFYSTRRLYTYLNIVHGFKFLPQNFSAPPSQKFRDLGYLTNSRSFGNNNAATNYTYLGRKVRLSKSLIIMV